MKNTRIWKTFAVGLVMLALLIPLTACQSGSAQGATDWATYTDDTANYSFQYPQNSRLQVGQGAGSSYNQINLLLSYDSGSDYVYFFVLDNPQSIPIDEFIQSDYALFLSTPPDDLWRETDLSAYLTTRDIAGVQAVQVERNEATLPLTGACKYCTYIPQGEIVVGVALCTSQHLVDAYEPQPKGLELYNQVLETLEFSSK